MCSDAVIVAKEHNTANTMQVSETVKELSHLLVEAIPAPIVSFLGLDAFQLQRTHSLGNKLEVIFLTTECQSCLLKSIKN